MITFTKIVNNTTHKVDVWVSHDSTRELYKLGIQATPLKGKIYSFSGRFSEEFVEDEIDLKKNIDYLESLLKLVVDKHLEEIIKLVPNTEIGNVKWWFKEAKKELDN